MNRLSPTIEDFAQWLVAAERNNSGLPAKFGGVVEKLRRPLSNLTDTAGFGSLLSRALTLAQGQVRWLRGVHVRADGSLECPPKMAQVDRKEIAKAEVVLIAQLLRLLVTFVGEGFTVRLLQDIWPRAPIASLDSPPRD